jgi:hypothetical protein
MKYLSVLLLLVFSLARSHELSDQKYDLGDCITPIQENWSWYKEYAVVDDFGTSMKADGATVYFLVFPNRVSASGSFNKNQIDQYTTKVPWEYCLYQKSKMS